MSWIVEHWESLLPVVVAVLGLLAALTSNAEKAAALQRIASALQSAKVRGGSVGAGAMEIIAGLKANAAGDPKGVVGEIADAAAKAKGRKPANKAKKAVRAIGKALIGKFLTGGL